jgi:hypothetical protein
MVVLKDAVMLSCVCCKELQVVACDTDKLQADLQSWRDGAFIQDALNYLPANQRELFQSGTCAKCWDKMFPEDFED